MFIYHIFQSSYIKRFVQFIIFLMLSTLIACNPSKINLAVSTEYSRDTRLRIAVLDFDYKAGADIPSLFYAAGTSKNAGNMIADLLAEEMMGLPGIVVIERSKLKSILDEKHLSVSGLLESKELNNVAKLAGIDAFVSGSVGEASASNVLGIFQESTVAFQARCIRASDGLILWSGSIVTGEGRANIARTLNAAAKEFGEELRKKLLKN